MLLCNCFNFKPAITYNSSAFPFTTSLITNVPNNHIISVTCYRNLLKKPKYPKNHQNSMLLCNCFNFKPAITYNSLAFPFTTSHVTNVPNNHITSVPCYRNLLKNQNTPKIIKIQCYCATVLILSPLLLTVAWLSRLQQALYQRTK